jgi:citrate lyase subunit alpha/citrate CoA-transferase
MKESKVVSSLREAIRLSGLKDGMCVSFHHHLRNGDYVVNMVMEQITVALQIQIGAYAEYN